MLLNVWEMNMYMYVFVSSRMFEMMPKTGGQIYVSVLKS